MQLEQRLAKALNS